MYTNKLFAFCKHDICSITEISYAKIQCKKFAVFCARFKVKSLWFIGQK